MPVQTLVCGLFAVDTDGLPAGLARLGKEAVEAAAAAGPAAPHHVALPAQRRVALQAAEVLRVPAPALCLDALFQEDQLITGGTARSEELGVVPAAVDPLILLEVDEVHQGLVADVAAEAGRVPELPSQPRRRNPEVPFAQPPAALPARTAVSGAWYRHCHPLAQRVPSAAGAERPELLPLLLLEVGAVPLIAVLRRQLLQEGSNTEQAAVGRTGRTRGAALEAGGDLGGRGLCGGLGVLFQGTAGVAVGRGRGERGSRAARGGLVSLRPCGTRPGHELPGAVPSRPVGSEL